MADPIPGGAFCFLAQSNLLAGNGLFRKLPELLRERGYATPGLLVDEGFATSSLWIEVKARVLSEYGGAATIHQNPGRGEPTYQSLRTMLERFRGTKSDVIVGVGGGSCMDTAKAVAALLTNPGDPLEYRGFDKLKVPGIPTVLVPTTAGTGSEASFNASFVDGDSKRKMGINGRHMFAALAILDGETTLSCPYFPALGAAVDALVHTLEGFVCKQHTPMSDTLARGAFGLVVNALPSLKSDPQNLERRLELLLGAYLGGLIQMNSGSGVAAAISYPLSVYYGVPHGIGGGIFCTEVIKFNIQAAYYRYAELAPLAGVARGSGGPRENAIAVQEHLEALWREMGVPRDLSGFGIKPDQFAEILAVMHTQQPAFDQNPIPFTVVDHLPGFLRPFVS
jgi:alcohol dehydrogenase